MGKGVLSPAGHSGDWYVNQVKQGIHERKMGGDDSHYQVILEGLQEGPEDKCYPQWLRALSQHATGLTQKHCPELLTELFKFDWACDPEVCTAYTELLFNMVSSNAPLLEPALRMMVLNFYPIKAEEVDGDYDMPKSKFLQSRIHPVLQNLITLAPMGQSCLMPVLVERFPHKRKDLDCQQLYLSNLLHVMDYATGLRDSILATIVDHLVQIDVEITLEDIPDDDQFVFDVELDDQRDGSFAVNVSSHDVMGEKLDMMMGMLFDHIQKNLQHDESFFLSMISVFDRYILNTYKSKYTQFLLFYMCSFNDHYTETFLEHLHQRLFDTASATVSRQACASYIASFVARAAFIGKDTLETALNLLFAWAHDYLDAKEAADSVPSLEADGVFYSVCQAIFYIVCYEQDHLLKTERGKAYMLNQKPERIIQSRFNPLKVCAESVATEFARLATVHGIYDCGDVVRQNYAARFTQGAWRHLELFFPFDPYLLRESSKYLKHMYKEWKDEDDDDEEEEEEDDESGDSSDDDFTDDDGMLFTPNSHDLHYKNMRRALKDSRRSSSYMSVTLSMST